MFATTSRIVVICGTIVLLAVLAGVFYLVAAGKLTGADALNVVFVVLGALGVGGAAHAAVVATRSGGGGGS